MYHFSVIDKLEHTYICLSNIIDEHTCLCHFNAIDDVEHTRM